MSVKLSGDSVRSYLRDIGRIPLLEHDEEILLGRQVQRLMEIKACKELLGEITQEDLAKSLGMTEKELRHYLPIAFGAVIDWANIMALDFISCTSDTLPPFICNVKSHPQGFLMSLPIRL